MKKFLLMLCLIILNACSVAESDDCALVGEAVVYYGSLYAFKYGTKIEVGSMTWTRSEDISSCTYIYTSTVSYTTEGFYESYYDESIGEFVNGDYIEGETVKITYYMKVEGMSTGIALYSSDTSYDSAKNSTSYQVYTYDITEEPEEYVSNDLPYY